MPLDTPEFTLIHDCAMSDRFLAFVVPPWKLGFDKVAGALSGASSFGHSFDWRDDLGTYLVIIEKATMAVVHQGTIPAMSTYHFAGAYEEVAEVPKPPGGSWDEHDDPFEFCGYTGFGDAECADDDVLDRKEDGKEDEEKEPRTRELLHILVNRLNGDRRALEANFSSMYDSVWDPTGYNTLCDYVVDLGTGALLSSEALVPTGDAAGREGRRRRRAAAQGTGHRPRRGRVRSLGSCTPEGSPAAARDTLTAFRSWTRARASGGTACGCASDRERTRLA